MASPIEVKVPDIGGFKDVNVIDVLVKDGQQIEKETPLVTIETEKAAMDVPAPVAGKIAQVKLKTGDKVSEGSLILLLEPVAAEAAPSADKGATAEKAAPAPQQTKTPAEPEPSGTSEKKAAAPAAPSPAPAPREAASTIIDEKAFSRAHASPSIRKFARELGADLGKIQGTGVKARITQDDVKAHVKALLTAAATAAPGVGLPRVPVVDFAHFGAVEVKPLSRIQKISKTRLQASWLNLPHVTQHEDADITDLEAARGALKDKAAQEGVRLTPLVFIIKACILALKEFPRFNASLDESGENLVFKKYFNIGFAADTPNGLMVPVVKDADKKGVIEIARETSELAAKARDGKLGPADMQGGTFSISSLGGIGGTSFTPIVNAPEVAILGVSKASMKPVWNGREFAPRLMMPLSLSYDHRVVDGALGARFTSYLSQVIADLRRSVL